MAVSLSEIAKAARPPRGLDPMMAADAGMSTRDALAMETRRQRKERYRRLARRSGTGLLEPYAPAHRSTYVGRQGGMHGYGMEDAAAFGKAAVPEPPEGYRRSRLAAINPRSETHVKEGTGARRLGTIAAGSIGGMVLGGQGAKLALRGAKRIKPVASAMSGGDARLSSVRESVRGSSSAAGRAATRADDAVLRATRGRSGIMPRSTEGVARSLVGGAVGSAATTAAINRNTSSGDVVGYNRRTGAKAKSRIAPPIIPGYYYRY